MRIALVILALWALVIEPTFSVFERLDSRAATAYHPSPSHEECAGLDQPVPPGEVVPAHWVNEHALVQFIAAILPPALAVYELPEPLASVPLSLPPDLALPFPPAVAPLRL